MNISDVSYNESVFLIIVFYLWLGMTSLHSFTQWFSAKLADFYSYNKQFKRQVKPHLKNCPGHQK